jgi:circadian clock protein KaiC
VRLRYVSIDGQLRRMLLVVKMRRSEHSIDMVEYQVTSNGVVIGERLRGYRALTSGIPSPWSIESDNIPQRRAEAEGSNPNG